MIQRQLAQNQEMRRWLRPVERLIEGNEHGHYALPENLTAAMAHLRTVQDAVGGVALPPNPVEAATKFAGTVREAPIPDDLGKKLLRAETRHEEALAQLQVLRLAETQAALELRNLVDANAEDIVTEGLRPALEEVLAEGAKLAPKLEGATTPEAIFRLADPTAARKVWFALEAQAARYGALRAAYDALFGSVFQGELSVMGADLHGLLQFRNFHALPRARDRVRVDTPNAPAEFMVWLMTSEPRPEPWLPLPDEVEVALRQARERVREQQATGFPGAAGIAARRREAQEQEERQRGAEPVGGWHPAPR
jgi:hypothetical protein